MKFEIKQSEHDPYMEELVLQYFIIEPRICFY